MPTSLETVLQDALGPQYRLERELEAGGMSRLFLATDLRLKRECVVKVLPPDLVSEASAARFKREIELTVRLQHPHILPILTSGEFEDGLFYITPFIQGESLRARIEREGKLPLDDILRILKDVSGALAFAHQRGIVHRDIKPGNILLSDGQAILADFGIARAVSTTATPLTESGVAPGTPAYMAPELPTDERADVYALGVVAYEMLLGQVPGRLPVEARTILAARGQLASESGPRLAALADVIARSLSRAPAVRPANAREFAAAIDAAMLARHSRRRFAVIGSTCVALLALIGWRLNRTAERSGVERYAVVSIGLSDSSGIDRAVRDALLEWRGVTVLLARSDPRGQRDLPHAREEAKALGAGHLIAVDARPAGDSLDVQATLYDVVGDSTVRVWRTAVPTRGSRSLSTLRLRSLVNGLLRGQSDLPWASASDSSAQILAAWRTYDLGRLALNRWDLTAAESAFRRSVSLQSSLHAGRLWLAQTVAWMDPRGRNSEIASLLADPGPFYGALDSLHWAALSDLAAQRFGKSCKEFAAMNLVSAENLAALLGLGDCQALDMTVVPSPASATGWSFESSFENARRSYELALERGPSRSEAYQNWIFGRLSHVLAGNTNKLRLGYALRDDSIGFAAFPILRHDTLAYEPFPIRDLSSGRYSLPPGLIRSAVERNRKLMTRAAEDWVGKGPANVVALDSLSNWLEISQGTATISGRRVTALELVRQAQSLSTDAGQQARLAVKEARLLLKEARFDSARVVASALLRRIEKEELPAVDGTAGLAALTGQVGMTAHFLSRDPENSRIAIEGRAPINLPVQVADLAARLVAFSSLGVESDTTLVLVRQTAEILESYFPDSAQSQALRQTLVGDALTLIYPLGSRLLLEMPEPRYPGYRLFRTLARGDTVGALRGLAELQRLSTAQGPGIAIDMNFRRAIVAIQAGDSASAIRELDPTLRALPTLSPLVLSQVPQAATLVRSFRLRAELAAARHDARTAVACAKAVVALWADADEFLRPDVVRMRLLLKKESAALSP